MNQGIHEDGSFHRLGPDLSSRGTQDPTVLELVELHTDAAESPRQALGMIWSSWCGEATALVVIACLPQVLMLELERGPWIHTGSPFAKSQAPSTQRVPLQARTQRQVLSSLYWSLMKCTP